MNAPATDPTTFFPASPPPPDEPHRVPSGRSTGRRRVRVAVLTALIVAVIAAIAVLLPVRSDGTATGQASDSSPGRLDNRAASTSTTVADPTVATVGDNPVSAPGGASFSPSGTQSTSAAMPSGPAPAAPQLQVVGSVVLDAGVYERDLVLVNTGGSPLTWNATPETGDQLMPASGVIAAADQVIVHLTADEYSAGSKQWVHTVTVHSDGGDAQVAVHGTTLLPAEPSIIGGTFVNNPGNVYVFPQGALNGGITFKNEGDLALNIHFDIGGGGRAGTPDLEIEGGQTFFAGFSVCGIPAPVVKTSVDVPMNIEFEGIGTYQVVLRFNLNAAQATGPC